MTRTDFILQVMLQLAGTGKYKDEFDRQRGLVTKEKQILEDAVKLADCAASCLCIGDVSNAYSVFESEDLTKKEKWNEQHKTEIL